MYLDGTLRFAAIVLPPAAAGRLARGALSAAAAALLAPLDSAAVKKFNMFGAAGLEHDTAGLLPFPWFLDLLRIQLHFSRIRTHTDTDIRSRKLRGPRTRCIRKFASEW